MGGAADLPQRSSSPLKRPAAELDTDLPSSQKDDVDMIELPMSESTKKVTGVTIVDESADKMEEEQQSSGADVLASEPEDGAPLVKSASTDIPSVDVQIKTIQTLCEADAQRQPVEGEKVYLVSKRWLNNVISHSAEARSKSKTEPERELGPIDNSDITKCVLIDAGEETFVQLKSGLGLDHFTIFPQPAWDLVMEWYGLMPGLFPIIRYPHDTNYGTSGMPQVQYEFYPLVFKLHRLYSDNGIINVSQLVKATNPPPPMLVFSRSAKYVDFLSAIKEKTSIPKATKVRVWRVPRLQPAAEPTTMAVNTSTPPSSRPSSPSGVNSIGPMQAAPQDSWAHMLLDLLAFTNLQRGSERELIDFRDHSSNLNYNGSMNMDMAGVGSDESIVVDELINGDNYITNYVSKGVIKSSNRALVPSNSQINSGRSSPAPPGPMTRGRAKKAGKPQGAVGLSNLGNTCYMNSALQCVRSVEELTKYFLTGAAEKELNRDNPLGNNGEIALAYGSLLEDIYRDNAPSNVAPRHFKTTIGRFAPSFSGYGQQDSQEFLGFLLDGLQEDLSRVKKKPYIEKPDSTDEMVNDPQAIREMAAKVWDITKKRDDSVIADLFTGMYKSTLVCPHCDKVSITFDPFNNLTLQLPVENSWGHKVQYFPLNDKPVQMSIDIDKNASNAAIKAFVSNRVNVPTDRLFMAEEFKSKFYKLHKDHKVASEDIQGSDNIFIYELEAKPTNWPAPKKTKKAKKSNSYNSNDSEEDDVPDWSDPIAEKLADKMLVPVFHRHPANPDPYPKYGKKQSQWLLEPMCHFVILSPEDARSEDMIKRKILEKVATFTTSSEFDDEFDTNASVTDSTDADLVITTGSDADSSGGSKVVAHSIDGDEELVDVAMNDSPPKPTPIFSTRRPKFINPKSYLNPQLQNMFEVGYFSDCTSMVPTGWNVISEDKPYPNVTSRAPHQQSSNEDEAEADADADTDSSPRSLDGHAQSESSVESASYLNSVLTTTRMVEEESSDEDAVPLPPKILPVRSAGKKSGVKVGHKQRRLGPMRTYSKKSKQSARKTRNYDANDSEPSESSEQGPLVRLGEGLVVDWSADAWDILFGSDGPDDTFRGRPTCMSNVRLLDDPELAAKRAARAARRKNGITLDDCLNEFGKEEILSEMDTWYCPRCKEHRRAIKRFELWKTPDILVMHLKRFSSSGYRRDKLDVFVDFPVEGLNLGSRVIETEEGKEELYDLLAVDDHWGGLGGGHYTAFAKNFFDNEWWEYNDTSATKVTNTARVVSASAYLLFYRRRSSVPLGGPRLRQIVQEYNNSNGSSEDETSESGEDRGLVGTSFRGSSSALTGVGAVRHQQSRGSANGAGIMTINPLSLEQLPAYESRDQEEHTPQHTLLSDAATNDGLGLQTSIEDEGIDIGSDSEGYGSKQLLPQPAWSFQNINSLGSNSRGDLMISGTGSDAASDEVQHNSSASEGSIQGRLEDFDHAVAEDDGIPFVDQSPVPDLDDAGQASAIALQADLLEKLDRGDIFPRHEFEVTANDENFEVEEPAVDIHVSNSDDLKID